MEYGHLQQLISVSFVAAFKLAALLVGYLGAKLGHDLFLRGITGEFTFRADLKGWKADLVGASPGLFFILMGAAIVTVTIYRGFDVNWEAAREEQAVAEPVLTVRPRPTPERSGLPSTPPPLAPRPLPGGTP